MCMLARKVDRYRVSGRYSIGLALRATPGAHGQDLGIWRSEVLGAPSESTYQSCVCISPYPCLYYPGLD